VLLFYCGAIRADALTVDRLASLEKYSISAVMPQASILETEAAWLNSIKADLERNYLHQENSKTTPTMTCFRCIELRLMLTNFHENHLENQIKYKYDCFGSCIFNSFSMSKRNIKLEGSANGGGGGP
ncbi:hypothetical protein F2P56_036586, partial [Juglans regia]